MRSTVEAPSRSRPTRKARCIRPRSSAWRFRCRPVSPRVCPGTEVAAPVAVELSAGVLTVTLDRADKRNALNSAVVEGLHEVLERADLDADVRVVLLRGAGKDFCAGADLEELLASADRSPGDNEASAARLGAVFTRLRRMPKPVVGIVHGRALAGGAGLATACDIVVAGASAQLGYPEIQRGFVPAMVMTLLRRLTGEKAALDLVLTGRLVGAEEARTLGLVSRVVPDAQLEEEGQKIAAALATASPSAVAFTKRLFFQLDGKEFEEGIALGARVNATARQTPDFREAIARFLRQ
ncbi:MAG: enoyl-CoA hydratase/isomerase family protein [Acidobacteria bacterium]|nr:MAG: enoyl-CoA hydratase/isomerase family protein [Acidobacteriota bacterium]